MKISISFLKSCYDFKKTIDLINKSNADYIHIDVVDGLFSNSKTNFTKNKINYLKKIPKKKDVHLMTLHLKDYIDVFSLIKPEFITFQFESTTNHLEIINYIKSKNIKVGLAISPFTNLKEITPFLSELDLVLIMSVIPGYGGQKFIIREVKKVKELNKLKEKNKYNFLINVDGGIDYDKAKILKTIGANIIVAGSYVCNNYNFDENIDKLKEL